MKPVYPHPLDICHARLRRAQEHIETFNQAMDAFLDTNPIDAVQEVHSDGTKYVYRAVVRQTPPIRLSPAISDCIHNLRAALDHIVWHLAGQPVGKQAARVEFPLFDDPSRYSKAVKKTLIGVPDEAKAVIERLQPFQAASAAFQFGPPLLSALYHLSNFDKHRTIHLLWSATKRATVQTDEMPIEQELFGPILEDGAKLASFTFAKPDVQMHVRFHFTVILHIADLNAAVPITYLGGIVEFIGHQIIPQFEPFFSTVKG